MVAAAGLTPVLLTPRLQMLLLTPSISMFQVPTRQTAQTVVTAVSPSAVWYSS